MRQTPAGRFPPNRCLPGGCRRPLEKSVKSSPRNSSGCWRLAAPMWRRTRPMRRCDACSSPRPARCWPASSSKRNPRRVPRSPPRTLAAWASIRSSSAFWYRGCRPMPLSMPRISACRLPTQSISRSRRSSPRAASLSPQEKSIRGLETTRACSCRPASVPVRMPCQQGCRRRRRSWPSRTLPHGNGSRSRLPTSAASSPRRSAMHGSCRSTRWSRSTSSTGRTANSIG